MDKNRKSKPKAKEEQKERPSFAQFLKEKGRSKWVHGESEKIIKRRFLGFHEQMKRIDVKLSHNPDKVMGLEWKLSEDQMREEILASKSSYFISSLQSQTALDTSKGFFNVSRKLTALSMTFPMVIHNLDEIVEIIIERLGAGDDTSAKTLLDLLIALIKDARQLIFPSFLQKIMPQLIRLIDVEKVELLEHIFATFSYSFKFLQRQILQNLPAVYLCYFELLASNIKYARKFAAESFAFIIRGSKHRDIKKSIDVILDPLKAPHKYMEIEEINKEQYQMENTPECFMKNVVQKNNVDSVFSELFNQDRTYACGDKFYKLSSRMHNSIVIAISQLLSEILQGAQGTYHSKAKDFLMALFSGLISSADSFVGLHFVCRYAVVLLVEYLDPKNDSILHEALQGAFPDLYSLFLLSDKPAEAISPQNEAALLAILVYWKDWLSIRKGAKLSSFSSTVLYERLNNLFFHSGCLSYATTKSAVQLLALLLYTKPEEGHKFFRLNFDFGRPDPTNLLKIRLYSLRPYCLLFDFLKTLEKGFESDLKFSLFPSDFSHIQHGCINTEMSAVRSVLRPFIPNILGSTLEKIGNSSLYQEHQSDILKNMLAVLKVWSGDELSRHQVRAAAEPASANLVKMLSSPAELHLHCLYLDYLSKIGHSCDIPEDSVLKLLTLPQESNIDKALMETTVSTYDETMIEFCKLHYFFNSFPNYSLIAASRSMEFISASLKIAQENKMKLFESLFSQIVNNPGISRVNPHFLSGIESIVNYFANLPQDVPETELYKTNLSHLASISSSLAKNLSSNSRTSRILSLKIISNIQNLTQHSCGLIPQLLEIEDLEVGLQTEKEKMSMIRDLKIYFTTHKVCPDCLVACVHYFLGNAWVKFSPLHLAAEDVLASLMEKHETEQPELLKHILSVLRLLLNFSYRCSSVEKLNPVEPMQLEDGILSENENLYKIQDDYTELQKAVVATIRMLKKLIKGLSSTGVEQITTLFCEFAKFEFKYEIFELIPIESDLFINIDRVNILEGEDQIKIREMSREKMRTFLEVLTEADTLTSQKETLEKVAFFSLSSTDERTQVMATRLLNKLGNPVLVQYQQILFQIASASKNKDVLRSVDFTKIVENRTELIHIVTLLFHGKIVKKKGKRLKVNKFDLTPTIFNIISMWAEEEVLQAAKVILSQYGLNEKDPNLLQSLARIPFTRLRGLCYTLKLIFKHLGRLIDPLVAFVGEIILGIMKLSYGYYSRASTSSGEHKKIAHTIFTDSIKRLKQVFTLFNESEQLEIITDQFIALADTKIKNMKLEQSQGRSNILDILVIWSGNPKYLQRYFLKYPFIIDSLFEILTVPKIVPDVASSLFQILFNVLFLTDDSQMNDTKRVCDSLLVAKGDNLVSNVYTYLSQQSLDEAANSHVCGILSELVHYISSDALIIKKLMELLVPHLFKISRKSRHRDSSKSTLFLLRTFKTLFNKYPEARSLYFHQFAPLLLRVKGLIVRYELSELLSILSESLEPELRNYTQIVQSMNHYVSIGTEIDLDYDTIVKETSRVNAILEEGKVKLSYIKPVLYQYLSNIEHNDYSLRAASIHGILEYLKKTYQPIVKTPEYAEHVIFIEEDFLPTIRRGLKSKDDVILRGIFEIVRVYLMASALSESKEHHLDLRHLLKINDDEQDFFMNIMHTQLHRRFKALRMATKAVMEKHIGIESQIRVLLPLANNILSLGDEDPEKLKKYKASGYVRQITLDAIELIGAIVPQLTPDGYFRVLKRYTTKLRHSNSGSVVGVVCKILDNFVFPVPDAMSLVEAYCENSNTSIQAALTQIHKSKTPLFPEEMEKIPEDVLELRNNMKKTIFPILKGSISVESRRDAEGERHHDIQPAIALALFRIIKKLNPKQYLDEFEKIVILIVAPLRSKDHELRDKVRSVIYQSLECIAPCLLHILIDELINGLTQDYQRHVLLFTVHGMFFRMNKLPQYAQHIDHCLDNLLPLVGKGVLGELAEESETDEVQRHCKEARDNKACDLYGLIAQLVDSSRSLQKIIQPIVDELEKTSSVKIMNKCEVALNKIVEGTMKNTNLSPSILMDISLTIVEKGFTSMEQDQKEEAPQPGPHSQKEYNFLVQEGAAGGKRISLNRRMETKNKLTSGRALVYFGMSLISAGVSKGAIKLAQQEHVHQTQNPAVMFDSEAPMNPAEKMEIPEDDFSSKLANHIVKALESPYSQLIQVALRILDKGVNSFSSKGTEILSNLIKQFDYFNMGDREMVYCLFRCVTHIIESKSSGIALSSEQTKALLKLIKAHMREAEEEVQVFRCIRAIVNSSIQYNKMEVIISRVSEILITTLSRSIREVCGGIVVDWLRKHPTKIIDQIQFILKNLGYENDNSRIYLYLLLDKILSVFDLFNSDTKWVDTAFVTLVLRLANEDSAQCKKRALELIERIVSSVSKDLRSQFTRSVFVWLKEPKIALKTACFQLIGIFLKVIKDGFLSEAEAALDSIREVLENSEATMEVIEVESDAEISKEVKGVMRSMELLEPEPEESYKQKKEWVLCYMALLSLEKHFEYLKGHMLNFSQLPSLMSIVGKLLIHPHYWVKKASCRLIGHYFVASKSSSDNVFLIPEIAENLIDNHYTIFRSQFLDESLATQASKNLLYLASHLKEESKKNYADVAIKKFSHLGKTYISGTQTEQQKMPFVVRLLAGLVLSFEGDTLSAESLSHTLSLLHRLTTNEKHIDKEAGKLAVEVMEALKQKVGTARFTETLTAVQLGIEQKKLSRKRREKELKVAHPEAAIRVKMKQKDKAHLKRKEKNKKYSDRRKGIPTEFKRAKL